MGGGPGGWEPPPLARLSIHSGGLGAANFSETPLIAGDGASVWAHTAVIKVASPVLKAMLESTMQEGQADSSGTRSINVDETSEVVSACVELI